MKLHATCLNNFNCEQLLRRINSKKRGDHTPNLTEEALRAKQLKGDGEKIFDTRKPITTATVQGEFSNGIGAKIESSTNGDLRRLFEQLNIDVMAEYGTELFPAFRHGCAAIQGILTQGKSIFDEPVFNETERKMFNQWRIQLYTTSSLMDEIKAFNKKLEKLTPEFIFQERNISFPAVVIVNEGQRNKIEQWISSLDDNGSVICVLLVSKEQDTTYIAPRFSVFQSTTTISDIMEAADDLLERAIFAVLKNIVGKCVDKYGDPTHTLNIEKENTMQNIYAYARSAYKRSEVPIPERLSLPEITHSYPKTIDEIISRLLKIEGVIGCSKNNGYIEVLVDNTADSEQTTRRVKQLLAGETVEAIFIYGKFTNFISTGDSVYNGTLGGFAQSIPKNSPVQLYNRVETDAEQHYGKLVALISLHVANANREDGHVYLRVDDKIIGEMKTIHENTLVDILPIEIYEEYKNMCNTRFKTETGKEMHGQLLVNEENKEWVGAPVHIWGAKTSLGLGTISAVDLETSNGLLITINDRTEGESFCKPGDSGAMVCATDRRERTLYAVAMLVGKLESLCYDSTNTTVQQPRNNVTYCATLLDKVFTVLGEHYDSIFMLYTGDSGPK
ncbi:uncharacterized protein LOC127837957 isoform X2 [Dreissena polymorpha]|uniref:uncharacterized protein LOC127837957 isoform X2 n=1 Tax=Dreissena polymorpha TaxID=45954 RepID=UPI00226422EC|nr:uncharacterized protein LOC127837957 isoform X2 [Dreissena polymorpha]